MRHREHQDLGKAVAACARAVVVLREQPRSPVVAREITGASSAVAELPTGLATEALYRLLAAVEDCHRTGTPTSPLLGQRTRAVARLIRLSSAA